MLRGSSANIIRRTKEGDTVVNNDRSLIITVGTSRKAVSWQRQELMWSELCEKLSAPQRTTEKYTEYMALPKAKQDEIKDVGGFVGGTLEGIQRKASAVSGRDIVTLDLDNIPAGQTSEILRRIDGLGFGYCVYSTRKHSEAAPRLRVLIPLNRTCTADEYEPLARKLAEFVGMEYCDPTTFQASRLMYWPSCSADSQYVYTYADKPFVDVDGVLTMYVDWHDVAQWQGMIAPKLPRGGKQADPTEKSGIVGAFCRTYDIYRAMDELLPGVYLPCGPGVGCGNDRYTYSGGSTTGGAVVYEDGKYLYSHHATDPAGGRLCNAFDLVRLHMFGDRDDGAAPDTPANRLPSFAAMCEFAAADKEVSSLLNTEKYEKAVSAFGNPPTVVPGNDLDWIAQLEVSATTGLPKKTTDNIIIILENDPMLKGKLRFDEFSNRVQVIGAMPWDMSTGVRSWTDNDDAGIRHYLEKAHGITGVNKILDACSLVCHRHTVNAVRDYLNALPAWDGVPRLDTLFVDYLGAEDNSYVRAVARKSFAAAVARAMQPGVKYDTMPILAGPQGIGKSTLLRIMGGDWFSDSLGTFEGKESYELIQGSWLLELGELNGLSKAEMGVVKQFLSKVADIFREPYGRRTREYPRRCVFFGTTNEAEFLRDKTGNRRFWPVDCGINQPTKSVFRQLAEEVPQIWAEAVLAWKNGEKLYLEGDVERISQQEQAEHSEHNAKEGVIREFLERKIPADWDKRTLAQRRLFWGSEFARTPETQLVERTRVCAIEVWCEALGGDMRFFRKSDAAEINGVLGSIEGWKRSDRAMRIGAEYGVQRGFVRA
jgi:predicted P-loop ATPase